LGGRKGILPVKTEWWGGGVVICLELGADFHMAQLMPLPLTVSCFSKIQTGFTFLVPAYLGNLGQRAVKRVCVLLGGRIRTGETASRPCYLQTVSTGIIIGRNGQVEQQVGLAA